VFLPGRRDFLKAAAGGMVGTAFAVSAVRSPVAQAQPTPGRVTSLSNDLHVIAVGRRNFVAMTSSDGAVLVDGGTAEQSAGLLDTIANIRDGGPVRTLFNTCWHPECTGSNGTLARAGAAIVAHENTRLWLTQKVVWPWDGTTFAPLPQEALPNRTFYQTDKTAVGNREIRYAHVRACPHTDGDCYVFFPDANVLAVGDAVSGAGWPSVDWWTGGWIGGVVGGLESLLARADASTRIVPARGPLLSRADLARQYEMFENVYERLSRLLHGGIGLDEAVAARPLAEFEATMGPSDGFVRQAFQSLWGYIAPDA
jgi:cyclase